MQKAIQETITGAYETMQGMGVFVSPDGTTAEFSDEEIDAMVQDYNSKADRYYAKEAGQYAEYMAANEDYLRNAFKAPSEIYNVIDSGILSCDIQSIRMEDDGQTAMVTVVYYNYYNKYNDYCFHTRHPVHCKICSFILPTVMASVSIIRTFRLHNEI